MKPPFLLQLCSIRNNSALFMCPVLQLFDTCCLALSKIGRARKRGSIGVHKYIAPSGKSRNKSVISIRFLGCSDALFSMQSTEIKILYASCLNGRSETNSLFIKRLVTHCG